jgi:hypothetical protein
MSRASLFAGSNSTGEVKDTDKEASIGSIGSSSKTGGELQFTSDGLLKEGAQNRAKVSPAGILLPATTSTTSISTSAATLSPPSRGSGARIQVAEAPKGIPADTPNPADGPETIEAFYRAA